MVYGARMRVFGILIVILGVTACGRTSIDPHPRSALAFYPQSARGTAPGSSQNRVRPPLKNPLLTLSYEYTEGRCTTGLHRFQSTHELCMNLLNPKMNRNCASQTREEAFHHFCEPKGYRPFDGLQCRFGLLKTSTKDVELSNQSVLCYDAFSKDDFVTVGEACLGRSMGAKDEAASPIQQSRAWADDLTVSVEAVYARPNSSTPTSTHFSAWFFTPADRQQIEYTGGRALNVGCSIQKVQGVSQTYRVFSACKPVVGCRR